MITNIQLHKLICNLIANNINKTGGSNYELIRHHLQENPNDNSHLETWVITHSYTILEAITISNLNEDLINPAREIQNKADAQFLQDIREVLKTELQEHDLDHGIFIYTHPHSGWCITIHRSNHGFYITECTALD